MVDVALREAFKNIDNMDHELNDAKAKEYAKKKRLAQLRHDCFEHLLRREEEHASERIVEYIEETEVLYTTRDDIKSEVWRYDDGIYKPNGESFIKEVVRGLLLHAYTPQRVNKIIAKIHADTQIDTDKFFNVCYVDEIPVLNGILNIKTRKLSEFTPDKIFFNKIPVKYDANAKCDNIKVFFSEILKDEGDIDIAFELYGYTLLKDHPIEKAAMLVGNGRNGKGKFISLLKTFIGAENCCSVPLAQLKTGSTSICELFGKMANLAGDLNNTSLKETGLFKEITGRDMVGAPRKYLRDLFFVNHSKQIFACNELPIVYDFSAGFWSRWILLEFPYQFLDKSEYEVMEDKNKSKIRDINIIDKLTTQDELSGLLNESLDGLERLLSKQDFSKSRGTDEIKNFWIRNSDSFTAFCLDNVESDYDGIVSKKKLRTEFMKYCKLHKVKGTSDKAIKIVLENMFGATEGRKIIDNQQESGWEGIKLKVKNVNSKDSKGISESTEKSIFLGMLKNHNYPYYLEKNDKNSSHNPENEQKSTISYGDFTDEDIEKAGYSKKEIEELSLENENTSLNKTESNN